MPPSGESRWASTGQTDRQTDRRTDGRQTVKLRFPLEAASIIWQCAARITAGHWMWVAWEQRFQSVFLMDRWFYCLARHAVELCEVLVYRIDNRISTAAQLLIAAGGSAIRSAKAFKCFGSSYTTVVSPGFWLKWLQVCYLSTRFIAQPTWCLLVIFYLQHFHSSIH